MVKNARKWLKLAFSYQYLFYFSKSLVQNCLNICFESLRYVVYETKAKKIWHCICIDLRKVKVKVTLEKDNTKLAFIAHVIVDLAII